MKQFIKVSTFVLGMAMASPAISMASDSCEEPFSQLAVAAKAQALLAEADEASGRDEAGIVTDAPAEAAATASDDPLAGMFDGFDDTTALSGDVESGMFDGSDGLNIDALVDMLADGEGSLIDIKTHWETVEEKYGVTQKELAQMATKDAAETFAKFKTEGPMAFLEYADNLLSGSEHTQKAIERLRGENMEKLGDAGEVLSASLETVLLVVNEGVHPDKVEEVLAERAERAENPSVRDRFTSALKLVRSEGSSAILSAMRGMANLSPGKAVNTLKGLSEAVMNGTVTDKVESELEQYTNSVAGFVERIRQPFAEQMGTVQTNIERVEDIYTDLYKLQVAVETKKAAAILMIKLIEKRKSQLDLSNKGQATIAKQLDLAVESLRDKVEAWKGALLGMDTDRLVLMQLHANFIRLLRTAKLTLDVQMTRFVANLEKMVMIKDANTLAASLMALRNSNNETMKAIADQMTEAIEKINALSRVSSVDLEATRYVIDKIKAMQNNVDRQNAEADARQLAEAEEIDAMSEELRERLYGFNQAAAEDIAASEGGLSDDGIEADSEVATDKIKEENAAVSEL